MSAPFFPFMYLVMFFVLNLFYSSIAINLIFLFLSNFYFLLRIHLSPLLYRERRTVFSENVTLGARDTVNWRACTPPVATHSEWLRTTTLARGAICYQHFCKDTFEWNYARYCNGHQGLLSLVPCSYALEVQLFTWQPESWHMLCGKLTDLYTPTLMHRDKRKMQALVYLLLILCIWHKSFSSISSSLTFMATRILGKEGGEDGQQAGGSRC